MKPPLHVQEINQAREWYNPLRGLDIGRVVRLLEDAERGRYDELQKLNRMTEKRHPTLKALKERRLGALQKLDWDVKIRSELPAGITQAQAEQQQEYLRNAYENIENLPAAVKALALATFRGYAHLEKRFEDDDPSLPIIRLNPVPQWHWLKHPDTFDWRYDATARYDINRSVPIERQNFIIREVDDPLCEIALLCFIRRNFAKKDWTGFLADYGIPSIFATLGENTPIDKVAEWLTLVKQVTSNSRGALPPGSTITPFELGNLEGIQFQNFISAEDADLVLAGTGGLLTMLTANTGMGDKGQADNHEATFTAIALAEAADVNSIFQSQFDKLLLAQEFPSQPAVAYFELAAEDEEDVTALADTVQKLHNAGLEADEDQISEKTGIKLTRAAPAAPALPGDPNAPVKNQPADQALKNRITAEGRKARFLAHSEADISAADQETLKPIINRVAALGAITDDAEFERSYRKFLGDLPALEAQCLGDEATAELEGAFNEIIGTAMVDGAVTAAKARKAPKNA